MKRQLLGPLIVFPRRHLSGSAPHEDREFVPKIEPCEKEHRRLP